MSLTRAPEVFDVPGIGSEDAHTVAVAGEAFADLLEILLRTTDVRVIALDNVQQVHAIFNFLLAVQHIDKHQRDILAGGGVIGSEQVAGGGGDYLMCVSRLDVGKERVVA